MNHNRSEDGERSVAIARVSALDIEDADVWLIAVLTALFLAFMTGIGFVLYWLVVDGIIA